MDPLVHGTNLVVIWGWIVYVFILETVRGYRERHFLCLFGSHTLAWVGRGSVTIVCFFLALLLGPVWVLLGGDARTFLHVFLWLWLPVDGAVRRVEVSEVACNVTMFHRRLKSAQEVGWRVL